MNRQKLWSANYVLLLMYNLCHSLGFYITMVVFTGYCSETYGLAPGVASLSVTVYVLAAIAARLLLGKQLDRWGLKTSLVIGFVGNLICFLLFFLPMSLPALIAVRAVHGVAMAIQSGSVSAAVVLFIPSDRSGEGIGYFSMMTALATGVGPLISISVINAFGSYTPLFVFMAVIAALPAIALAFVRIPQLPQRTEGDRESQEERGLSSMIQVSILPITFVLFLVFLAYSSVVTYVVSYAGELGLGDAVSFFFVVYSAVGFIFRPIVGKRVDRKGENSVIYACFASLAVAFVLLAFVNSAPMLIIAAAFTGFGVSITQSIMQTIMARDTPKHELGRANSTFFTSMDLGLGIGPMLVGAFMPMLGFGTSYLLLALVGPIAAILYYFLHHSKGARHAPDNCGQGTYLG